MAVRVCLILFGAFALAACSIDVSIVKDQADDHSLDPVVMGKGPDLCADGDVRQVVPLDRDNVLIWGDHKRLGQCGSDMSKFLDLNTGEMTSGPKVEGFGAAFVSDGNGGWYVSGYGDTEIIEGRPAKIIEHIRADGTVDPTFDAFKNSPAPVFGKITDMKLKDGRLYVAGDMQKQINSAGGPVDLVNGDSYYSPALSGGEIYGAGMLNDVVSDGGSGFYIAGNLREYQGEQVGGLIHVSANGQRTSSFNPTVSGEVRKILYDKGSKILYLLGDFWAVNGSARYGLAAIDTMTGHLLNWSPVLSGASLKDIAVSSKHGKFFLAGYGNDAKIQVLDLSSGNPIDTYSVSRSDGFSLHIYAVHVVEDYLYVGGSFTSLQGSSRNNAGAIDLTTGTVAPWNPNPLGQVLDISSSPDNSEIFLSGTFYTVNAQSRIKVASVHPLTAAVNSFNPSWTITGGDVSHVVVGADTVYVEGLIDTSATVRIRYAAFNRTTGVLLPWDPKKITGSFYNYGSPIAVGTSSVFILDRYVGHAPVGGLFVLNAVTGVEVPLAQNVNRWGSETGTLAFSKDGTLLFYGSAGEIHVGQEQREAVVVFNTADLTINNKILAVENGFLNRIKGMAVNEDTLYVGGYFINMGADSQSRRHLAAISVTTGNATSWNPNPDGEIQGLYKNGSDLYVYGNFTNIMGQARAGFAVFDIATGALKSPEGPFIQGEIIRSITQTDNALYIASSGDFDGTYLSKLYKMSLADYSFSVIQVGGYSYSSASDNKMIIVAGESKFFESTVESFDGLTVLNLQNRQLKPLTLNLPMDGSIQDVKRISSSKIAIAGKFFMDGENYGLLVADIMTGEIQKVKTDDQVSAGVIYNDVYYMRGSFTEVEGQPRSQLAAVNLKDLSVLEWSPELSPTTDPYELSSVDMIGLQGSQIYVAYNVYLTNEDYNVGTVQRFDPVTGSADGWSLKFDAGISDRTKLTNGVFSTIEGDFTQYDGNPASGGFLFLDLNDSEKNLQEMAFLNSASDVYVLGGNDHGIWYSIWDEALQSDKVSFFNRKTMARESVGSYMSSLKTTWISGVVEYDGFVYFSGEMREQNGKLSFLRIIRKSDGAVRY